MQRIKAPESKKAKNKRLADQVKTNNNGKKPATLDSLRSDVATLSALVSDLLDQQE